MTVLRMWPPPISAGHHYQNRLAASGNVGAVLSFPVDYGHAHRIRRIQGLAITAHTRDRQRTIVAGDWCAGIYGRRKLTWVSKSRDVTRASNRRCLNVVNRDIE